MSATRKRGFQGRARLSPEAIEKLLPLWKDLKDRHCRLNTSELVSFIVCAYVDRCLSESERKLMVDSHFDTKSFLKAVIENSDSEEEIHKAMQQITSRNKKGSKKKAPKMTALLDGELDE